MANDLPLPDMPLTISSEEPDASVMAVSPVDDGPGGSASAEAAVADRVLAAVMVDQLALVLGQQPVELVGEQIDGRVHVHGRGIRMERAAGQGDGGFGLVPGFVD